jgi:sec-independent protein translocase protein TatC
LHARAVEPILVLPPFIFGVGSNAFWFMSSGTAPRRIGLPFRRKERPRPPERIRPDGSRDVELPVIEHLRELRDRLIKAVLAVVVTTLICLIFAPDMVKVLVDLAKGYEVIALKPTEAFVSYVKVALYAGVALSMPILVYQLFRFLAPGLTRSEKRAVLVSLPAVTFFFLLGVVFCYYIVLPSALRFLLGFGEPIGVKTTPTISDFLSFVTRFLMAMGIAFETPVIIYILSRLGVATPLRLRKFRRWAYVLAFVVAAIITPTPDPINQAIVAVPIILLYELGIVFATLGKRTPASVPGGVPGVPGE